MKNSVGYVIVTGKVEDLCLVDIPGVSKRVEYPIHIYGKWLSIVFIKPGLVSPAYTAAAWNSMGR